MKGTYFLVVVTGFVAFTNIAKITEEDIRGVNKALDSYVESHDWTTVFNLLHDMEDIINVDKYRTPQGNPLIIRAVIDRNMAALKNLLEKYHANPNVTNAEGLKATALMYAVRSGNISMIKLLLEYGANPHQVDENGKSSLDWATTPEIRELLTSSRG